MTPPPFTLSMTNVAFRSFFPSFLPLIFLTEAPRLFS